MPESQTPTPAESTASIPLREAPSEASDDIDLSNYDPVEHFRSKLRKIQQQTRENTKPTILTKIIDAIDPHDPNCDYLIDEAQIAMRRVAHVHDVHCQKDPTIHETDARETGYALPSYEIHAMPAGDRRSWFDVIAEYSELKESLKSPRKPRYGFESNEALRLWLDVGEEALADIGDDMELQVPGIINTTPERPHQYLELYQTRGDKIYFNHTLYADWCRRSENFRQRKTIEWINKNYPGSTHCFYFKPDFPCFGSFKVHRVTRSLMQDKEELSVWFLILNTNQVHNGSSCLNKTFNTLKGARPVILVVDDDQGIVYPSNNREATLAGLEGDSYVYKRSAAVLLGPAARPFLVPRFPPTACAPPCIAQIVRSVESFLRPEFTSKSWKESVPELVYSRHPMSKERREEMELLDNSIKLHDTTFFYKLNLASEIYEDLRRATTRTSERRALLLLLMGELCRTIHHWALVRTAADEVLDVFAADSDSERRSKRATAFFLEYANNEFVDYWNTNEKVSVLDTTSSCCNMDLGG